MVTACDNVGMRYVEFPPAQMCKPQTAPERVRVTYAQFQDDYVWADPRWRQNEEWARARNRLMKLFDEAFAAEKPGVAIADKDYEKWEPIAALRGMQVPGENIRQISVFTDAAMLAATVEPEWAKPAEPPLPAAPSTPALPPAPSE